MMRIGCVEDSPGFSTVHLAQYDLGLSQRNYMKLLYKVKVVKAGKEVIWRPHESPGCSAAFSNFYKDYIHSQNLITGKVGNALALCVGAKKAYTVEKEILRHHPRYTICKDPKCVCCHLFRSYNKRDIPIGLYGLFKRAFANR